MIFSFSNGIDHLTEIKGNGKELRLDVTDNARAIKRLAKQLKCPILLLCQLNRGVEGRQSKKPALGDLRESGALEEIADVVTFLYRESYYTPGADPRGAEIITAKNRDGKTGSIKLHFYGEYTKFQNPENPF